MKRLCLLIMTMLLTASMAWADNYYVTILEGSTLTSKSVGKAKIPYIDEDGKLHDDDGNKTPDDDDDDCAEALPITSADGDVSLSGGWYFVEGDVYIHGTLKFTGDTHLILCDGAKLTVTNTAADGNGINCTFHIHKSCIKTQL